MRNVGAHWPTNSAHSSRFIILSVADTAIAPSAMPRKVLLGTLEVWDSIAPVNWSSRSPVVRVLTLRKLLVAIHASWDGNPVGFEMAEEADGELLEDRFAQLSTSLFREFWIGLYFLDLRGVARHVGRHEQEPLPGVQLVSPPRRGGEVVVERVLCLQQIGEVLIPLGGECLQGLFSGRPFLLSRCEHLRRLELLRAVHHAL